MHLCNNAPDWKSDFEISISFFVIFSPPQKKNKGLPFWRSATRGNLGIILNYPLDGTLQYLQRKYCPYPFFHIGFSNLHICGPTIETWIGETGFRRLRLLPTFQKIQILLKPVGYIPAFHSSALIL